MLEKSEIPAAFVQQFEEERAQTLRRRITWYCILALAILTFSVGGTLMDALGPLDQRPPMPAISFDLATDAAYALLHVAMLGYVLIRPRTRPRSGLRGPPRPQLPQSRPRGETGAAPEGLSTFAS